MPAFASPAPRLPTSRAARPTHCARRSPLLAVGRAARAERAPAARSHVGGVSESVRDAVRVLIIGGTGRAGAQTARALASVSEAATTVTIAGRDAARGKAVVKSVRDKQRMHAGFTACNFAQLDIADAAALAALMSSHDVVLHAAGPFQRQEAPNRVLRAALAARVDYVDICDDVSHARDSKLLSAKARAAGVRAVVCAGIYPGLSNLAAAAAVEHLPDASLPPRSVRIRYYTAGSGGIGATVLASTFLILSERAMVFDRLTGPIARPAAAEPEVVDFGDTIGRRTTFLMNLPEVASLHETLLMPHGGGDANAKFSTGPPFWNALLRFVALVGPRGLMANRTAMRSFARFSLPAVRFVDLFSGARTAFVVRVAGTPCTDGAAPASVAVTYEHERLEQSVGEATAAFVVEMIRDRAKECREIEAGVFYPEELSSAVRGRICKDGVRTADRFVIEVDAGSQ